MSQAKDTFLQKVSETALAGLLVAVIALIVLPVPLFVLDTLIAMNIAASVVLLMIPLYSTSTIALSTFPSLLLFTTLFRLSLNISSSKQILLQADAGHIIETFGNLVMGGSVIVGLIIFLIIAVVQFIVISKGAERVAEVGARFTLDAMPGKQMSIDADLRAGNISKDEAQRRRDRLDIESKLNGSMDGAMKFVKGDAIASVIIALVNIIGGITVGVLIKGMTVADAANRYTLLTIGDGMVSQIPSLFVSIAAGLVITRVTNANAATSLGTDIGRQILGSPKALLMSGIMLIFFILVPGFPKIQFFLIAGTFCFAGYRLSKKQDKKQFSGYMTEVLNKDGMPKENADMMSNPATISAVPLRLRCSPDLQQYMEPVDFETDLLARKKELKEKTGIPFPGLRLIFDETLLDETFSIDVNEIPVIKGNWRELDVDKSDGNAIDATPLSGALARKVYDLIVQRGADFIGVQETQNLIKMLEKEMPDLASEIQRSIPIMRITDCLRRLVDERVSLRYSKEIFESLLNWSAKEKDIILLVELIRQDVSKFFIASSVNESNKISAYVLSPEFESAVRNAIQQSGGGYLSLPDHQVKALFSTLGVDGINQSASEIVLCQPDIRRFLSRFINKERHRIRVMSFNEIPPGVTLNVVTQINV